jgi:hypothetical protein
MNVPRDVLLDLLPVYLSGEASAATRQLVEEALRDDPQLAVRLRTERELSLPGHPPELRPELELEALRRTRRLLGWQRWMFGLGIGCIALACSTRIDFRGARLTTIRPLILDYPASFGTLLAIGIVCLLAYARLRARGRNRVP